MSKSRSENKKLTSARGRKTQYQQAHPKAGAHFKPRSLYRSMNVPWQTAPGNRYLHPERHRTVREATT